MRNAASGDGGAAYLSYSNPAILNCTIAENVAAHYGGGVICVYESSPAITNCTITANAALHGGGVACGTYSSPTITNCILWGDAPGEVDVGSGSPVVTHSDIQGGWAGEGNIDADPLLVDPDSGDLHLLSGSPCIDAGDNEAVPADTLDLDGDGDTSEPIPYDLDGLPRFVDYPPTPDTGHGTPPIVDMGAYEFGIGDLNCDGIVNAYDIGGFILAVSSYPDCDAYYDQYPDCDPMLADINGDGIVNAYDIDGFIALVGGG